MSDVKFELKRMDKKRPANDRLPVTSSQSEIMPENPQNRVRKAVQKSNSKSVGKTCPVKTAGDSKKKSPVAAGAGVRIGYARVSTDDQELHL